MGTSPHGRRRDSPLKGAPAQAEADFKALPRLRGDGSIPDTSLAPFLQRNFDEPGRCKQHQAAQCPSPQHVLTKPSVIATRLNHTTGGRMSTHDTQSDFTYVHLFSVSGIVKLRVDLQQSQHCMLYAGSCVCKMYM